VITAAFIGIVVMFALGAAGHWWNKDWPWFGLSVFGLVSWSFLLVLRIGGW